MLDYNLRIEIYTKTINLLAKPYIRGFIYVINTSVVMLTYEVVDEVQFDKLASTGGKLRCNSY